MPASKRSSALRLAPAPTKRRQKVAVDPREKSFNQAFGERLAEARQNKDITQEAMASALGIGYHQYKKYEYGSRAFPLYLLRDLQTITDRSLYWFLTGRA